MEFIGKQIRIAREEAGLSQLDLAKTLGFESATAISLIEKGSRGVTVENLEKIAQKLHRDIKFFIGQDVDKIDVNIALRADPNITKEDKDMILRLIELARKRKNG